MTAQSELEKVIEEVKLEKGVKHGKAKDLLADTDIVAIASAVMKWYTSQTIAMIKKVLVEYYCCDNPNCGNGAICNYCSLRADLERIAEGKPTVQSLISRLEKERGE